MVNILKMETLFLRKLKMSPVSELIALVTNYNVTYTETQIFLNTKIFQICIKLNSQSVHSTIAKLNIINIKGTNYTYIKKNTLNIYLINMIYMYINYYNNT